MPDKTNYPHSWKESDIAALEGLFKRAQDEGLWFFHGGLSGPISLSPRELRAEQAEGNLVWGAVNWDLRDPKTLLDNIDREISALERKRQELQERIAREAAAASHA